MNPESSRKPNILLDKSLQFSLDIIAYTEKLESLRKFAIANQLLRSGTSIGANIREAQHGESPIDFVHKMKIAAKEAEETAYWLLLCSLSASYPACDELISDVNELQRLLTKIIYSSKKTIENQKNQQQKNN